MNSPLSLAIRERAAAQVAAGAVADEGDAGRVHIEQKTVLINRPRHSVAVLKPRREAEFRRQPVAYGNYRVPRVPGKPRADRS